MITIYEALAPSDVMAVRELFLEYASSLGFDLGFQDFTAEVQALPGDYGPPDGCLLLVRDNDRPAGCVALRRFSDGVCEMKRMYVRLKFRGRGLGRRLAGEVMRRAGEMGYRKMVLDTIASMTEAIGLYRSLGFREIPPYRYNPISGACYMALDLR